MAGPLAKKELSAGGCSRRNGKRKKIRGRRKYRMIDNIMTNGFYTDTKRKSEKKVGWRMLSLQWAERYDLLIMENVKK